MQRMMGRQECMQSDMHRALPAVGAVCTQFCTNRALHTHRNRHQKPTWVFYGCRALCTGCHSHRALCTKRVVHAGCHTHTHTHRASHAQSVSHTQGTTRIKRVIQTGCECHAHRTSYTQASPCTCTDNAQQYARPRCLVRSLCIAAPTHGDATALQSKTHASKAASFPECILRGACTPMDTHSHTHEHARTSATGAPRARTNHGLQRPSPQHLQLSQRCPHSASPVKPPPCSLPAAPGAGPAPALLPRPRPRSGAEGRPRPLRGPPLALQSAAAPAPLESCVGAPNGACLRSTRCWVSVSPKYSSSMSCLREGRKAGGWRDGSARRRAHGCRLRGGG